ncbi:UNVERIFIED_CONTAM: hypothetical protein RMT77_005583 [Armadillidium vulgare]|nr:Stearoyl-CoA desaturase 5 [Armadillidium vulgare]
MPPQNQDVCTSSLDEEDFELIPEDEQHHHMEERKLEINFKQIYRNLKNLDYSKVSWRNVTLFVLLHIYSVYGLYLLFTACMWRTIAFTYLLYFLSAMGITMGAHRLWSHRSYKAKMPLRIFLATCQTIAFQNSIFEWARDHRVHHKFSETDADPHNAQRGFFFSHMGWLMYRKHPDVIKKGKTLDMSDLLNDPVVRFQKDYYIPLMAIACFVIPTFLPWYLWGETFINSLMVPTFLRYCATLHITWMVNSLAHWIGSKPYDRDIYPSQNKLVATLALGEGWHNYHHVFPFDYRAAELGGIINFNITTGVIEFFSRIGQAYDLKTASPEMQANRAKRTGDGTFMKKRSKKVM